MKNYYSILGVTPDSTLAEIKAAYRSLARKFHPDINPKGSERFKDILEAYETLSDEKKRLQYDIINGFFKSAKQEKTYSEKAQEEYKKNSTPPQKQNKKVNKKDFSKKINEIFEEFTRKKDPSPQRGDDIYEDISITIKEAINGTDRIVNVMHTVQCPQCKGRKFINGSMCSMCNGTGEKNEHKKISVKIPKNVKQNTKLRIQNEGRKGKNGGANGDLYLKINIKSHSNIEIKDSDIICKLPITPFEAVLGGNILIPGFSENLTLKIPPKTNSGQKFRLAGQGIKNNSKSGDMIVIVYIEIPSSLSDDEIKLYEKLKKISSNNIRENI